MELEMYLNGKFVDSVPVNQSQLEEIDELPQQLQRKFCHELEYADTNRNFLIQVFHQEWMNLTDRN